MNSNLRILCTGKIVNGPIEWNPPMPPPEPEPDGTLQDIELFRLIQEAADTEDYENDIEDRAFWARGQW